MKKKLAIGLAALALAFSVGAVGAWAAGRTDAPRGAGYVDADGDGVCDNRGDCPGAGARRQRGRRQ